MVLSKEPFAAYGLLGLLLLTTSAHAALVERDLREPGDALITFDTITGLEWLDLTESVDFSFAEVEAGAGGFLADGWRHGTGAEVCGLFVGLGARSQSLSWGNSHRHH